MTIMYGIPNCDTIKKAKEWMQGNNQTFEFHNFKKDGISKEKIRQWLTQISWQELINRKGTTWRKLDQDLRDNMTEQLAIDTILANPSIIKRPVLETGQKVYLGFSPDMYSQLFT
ncbi:Spx/MgsR family RNA polymerase-binding regulatory protein [Gynuella sunshinyii]|uniref:Arsenate reductase and related protein, glutaredoxin family n=1 Tax=Gynuella sunshinyii YC6258 TaxID=1445510 RepID=A0A0C5VW35_9GAMM|nr:Spx/MgsR family RNA polymerase-binding regulatory protein [Gynuella sunshinyii]AJQ94669.1 arsenate reductase and related protein, glutaredoxin family [Gynuella sunshinyii YC6258]